jgi:hypothetical protein
LCHTPLKGGRGGACVCALLKLEALHPADFTIRQDGVVRHNEGCLENPPESDRQTSTTNSLTLGSQSCRSVYPLREFQNREL